MKKTSKTLNPENLPNHIVIIMDGNGRWAKQRDLDRLSGHKQGMKSASLVVKAAREIGIKFITLFAFSAQNWNRPENEVIALMKLLKQYLISEGTELVNQNIKLNAIGRLNELPSDVFNVLQQVMDKTRRCDEMTLTLALSYGGREEIVDAVNRIINNNSVKTVDENYFCNFLYTKDLPEPDLLIRTSGEMRLSNFLLWQLAYTE
ncbi:MAG: polyprenyl diphosphate synthase, partial [Thermodesulfobacteriota bacterium]